MFLHQTVIRFDNSEDKPLKQVQIKKATKNAAFSIENRLKLSLVFNVLDFKPNFLGQFF